MSNKRLVILLMLPVMLAASPAYAYIGPGAGAGAVAVVLGFLASVVMAFFAILWYPVKRVIKKFKGTKPQTHRGAAGSAGSS